MKESGRWTYREERARERERERVLKHENKATSTKEDVKWQRQSAARSSYQSRLPSMERCFFIGLTFFKAMR